MMTLRWLLAFLHLGALAIGLGAVWGRARALRALERGGSLEAVFTADTWWIGALALWLATGLVRLLTGLEKPTGYYIGSGVFWAKMAVVAALFIVELWPMTTILQWGLWRGRGRPVDVGPARRLALISRIQAVLVLAAVALAVALARS